MSTPLKTPEPPRIPKDRLPLVRARFIAWIKANPPKEQGKWEEA